MKSEHSEASGAERVGVYICHCGGNISDSVDVERVAEAALGLPGVSVARTNSFMCSDPGQDLIRKDVEEGLVNRVVVASCAPALHEATFRNTLRRAGLSPFLYEHANIREQVSWVHHGPAATEKAGVLVAAAAAKARLLEPLSAIRVEAARHATVIGGGIAGMRAALSLAARGVRVLLVEKSPFLGGRLARLSRLAPTGEDAAGVIAALAEKVLGDPAVTVMASSEITSFKGFVGNFDVTVKTEPAGSGELAPGAFAPGLGVLAPPPAAGETAVRTGAIVLATGFKTYEPREGEYGFGGSRPVVTLERLIALLKNEKGSGGTLTVDGKPVRRLAMIHCVGSRQIPGVHEPGPEGNVNEHCSRVCCAAVLQAAREIRGRFPQTAVLDFYRDIRTYGRGQEALYEEAAKNGVVFLRFEPESPPEVGAGGGGFPISIKVRDTLSYGEEVEAGVDLVVLAAGMEPGDTASLVEMMKLPVGADRFLLEVHPKLKPVEVASAGIFLAGACQAPMDAGEAAAAAQAAAVKAAGILARGFVELDPYVARVDESRCQGSGACVAACPADGALSLAESEEEGRAVRKARVNPALCTGCGLCVAACENRAIDVLGWRLDQYEAVVDAIAAA